MAYAYDSTMDQQNPQKNDEEKQDATVLSSTAGDIGADAFNTAASGSSDRASAQARQPSTANQVISRNVGKASNPFEFEKTRGSLAGAKTGIGAEQKRYMENVVAPYQYGQQQQANVLQYAREGGSQPDWLSVYQQGTPLAGQSFASKIETNFAPINALQTNAGIRNYLRNPSDPESRAGEQALDFSLINADPNFNLNREATLRDYSNLLKYKADVESETPSKARQAQLEAFNKYKQGITGTLDTETQRIMDEAKAAEAAYDLKYADLLPQRESLTKDYSAQLAKELPPELAAYIQSPTGEALNPFFTPKDASSTAAEDFLTADAAGDFNRIAQILGRGGKIFTPGRLAGKTAPGVEDLGFDRAAFRNFLINQAQKELARAKASPFADTGSYSAGNENLNRVVPGIAKSDLEKFVERPDAVFLSDGGRVPGTPKYDGDHPMNDSVYARLSPGEIVIPISAAQDKESAKDFIDDLPFSKTRGLFKNNYACGGKVKGYACGGKVKGYADGGIVDPNDYEAEIKKKYIDDYRQRQLEQGFDVPIPGVELAKENLDEMLTSRVVDPMARAGFPNVGAALATVPSTLAEALVPSTAADLVPGPTDLAMAIFKFNKAKNLYEKLDTKKMDELEKFPFSKQKSKTNYFSKFDPDYEPKYLFHSTRSNPKSIKESGLVPNVGEVVKSHYEDPELGPLAPLIFFSDNPVGAEYFATKQPRFLMNEYNQKKIFNNEQADLIANKLEDLRKKGVLTVTESKNIESLARKNPYDETIQAIKDKYLQDPEDYINRNELLPYRHVERSDFVTDQNVTPDYIVTGEDLVDYAVRNKPDEIFIRNLMKKMKKQKD